MRKSKFAAWRERHAMSILTSGIAGMFLLVIAIQVGC